MQQVSRKHLFFTGTISNYTILGVNFGVTMRPEADGYSSDSSVVELLRKRSEISLEKTNKQRRWINGVP